MSDRSERSGDWGPDTALTTGIIADDLTGGVLVAASLIDQGIPCPVVTEPAGVGDHCNAAACVVAGQFRLQPAQEAVRWFDEAQKALSEKGARHIIYKYCATFDSTDNGNIGPCADALMRHTAADRLGFCPAFPPRGVTIYQGHIFLGSELLCNSSKRFDPVTPMPDPDLVAVLQRQTEQKVALVSHHILTQGVEKTRCFIDQAHKQGATCFFFDAIDENDVATCADVTRGWPAMTGGDTLLATLPALQTGERRAVADLPSLPPGNTAIIAGSCAGATLRQLERFEEKHPVMRLKLNDAADDFSAVLESAVTWAREELSQGPIAVSIADQPESVERIQSRFGVDNARMLGERLCSELAAQLLKLDVNRFIVAGGETSGAVAKTLGLLAMSVYPHPDVPGGLCVSEPDQRLCCYFKAGKMGDETIFQDLVRIFRRTSDDS